MLTVLTTSESEYPLAMGNGCIYLLPLFQIEPRHSVQIYSSICPLTLLFNIPRLAPYTSGVVVLHASDLAHVRSQL